MSYLSFRSVFPSITANFTPPVAAFNADLDPDQKHWF
jgi:hypothetical protein